MFVAQISFSEETKEVNDCLLKLAILNERRGKVEEGFNQAEKAFKNLKKISGPEDNLTLLAQSVFALYYAKSSLRLEAIKSAEIATKNLKKDSS
mmetsp:Transcript_36215/g.32555  ORF Transcript_36215/g.32555 Transcript_36215/m.32555 type:complete len:94 (-) Transcript_36215:431-712(-)